MIWFANTQPLEDTAQDVLQKARALAAACNLPDTSTLLNKPALLRLQDGVSHPGPLCVPDTLHVITTDYLGMRVNCFLLLASPTRAAILFDTGTDVHSVLDVLNKKDCQLCSILITHGHGDHIATLRELVAVTGAQVFSHSHAGKKVSGSVRFKTGGLQIYTHLLPGHALDALAYYLPDLNPPLLVAGDAIFARSVGGVHHNHNNALDDILRLLASLPPQTVILPGHGPLTTVGDELTNNPFLAGRRPREIRF